MFSHSSRNLLAATTILISSAGLSAADEVTDMVWLNGSCTPESAIAKGPVNSEPTKKRLFCDAAAVISYGSDKNHILVNFARKKSPDGRIIGFGGFLKQDGTLSVERVYLKNDGSPQQALDGGTCEFSYKAARLTNIACVAAVDERKERTVPGISFDVAPE